jgi:hypothetical protein
VSTTSSATFGTWKLLPSEADVLVCVTNSKRLRRDAARCRSPAKLALLELSLEQAAFGAMLAVRMVVDRSAIGAAMREGKSLPPVTSKLTEVVCEHLPLLDDRAIKRASLNHSDTLEQLVFQLEFLEWVLPLILKPDGSDAQAPKSSSIQYRFGVYMMRNSLLGAAIVDAVHDMVVELRARNLRRLDRTVKDHALYVRMDELTGRAMLPESDPKAARLLRRASRTVENFARGVVMREKADGKLRQRAASARGNL